MSAAGRRRHYGSSGGVIGDETGQRPPEPGLGLDQHRRRSIRLQGYDYAQEGAYFVTICVQGRKCLFGQVTDDQMQLSNAGRMVQHTWERLPIRFPALELDSYVVMPNHLHAILVLADEPDRRGEPRVRPSCTAVSKGDHKDRPYGTPPGSVGRVVQAFKSLTTGEYVAAVKQGKYAPFRGRVWQRNYYEHIIRNEEEFNKLHKYISDNPLAWAVDRENPDAMWAKARPCPPVDDIERIFGGVRP
jgi:REP element-mobilizing transposase RayT